MFLLIHRKILFLIIFLQINFLSINSLVVRVKLRRDFSIPMVTGITRFAKATYWTVTLKLSIGASFVRLNQLFIINVYDMVIVPNYSR